MRSTSCAADRASRSRGAIVVEHLAVSILAVVCVLALAQLAVWVWARNVAVSAAHEGARLAAERGRPLDSGAVRARSVLRDGLGESATRFAVASAQDGDAVAVEVRGPAPTVLPLLPRFDVNARALVYDEDRVP